MEEKTGVFSFLLLLVGWLSFEPESQMKFDTSAGGVREQNEIRGMMV